MAEPGSPPSAPASSQEDIIEVMTGLALSWESEADEIDTGPGDPGTWVAARTLRECASELRQLTLRAARPARPAV